MGQSSGSRARRIEIENNITSHFTTLKNLSEEGISLINKGGNAGLGDVSKASDLADRIYRENEDIRDLLFDLEEVLQEAS